MTDFLIGLVAASYLKNNEPELFDALADIGGGVILGCLLFGGFLAAIIVLGLIGMALTGG